MNKITVVYERNEETNQIELRSVVIFKDGQEPVVKDYTDFNSLVEAAELARQNGYDVIGGDGKDATRQAIADGLITVISRTDTKAMAQLRAEILQEKIKSGALLAESMKDAIIEEAEKQPVEEAEKEVAKEKVEEPEVKAEKRIVKRLNIPEESRAFANYLKLYEKRAGGRELTESEIGELIGYCKVSERARNLENAIVDGRDKKTIDEMHDRYRAVLADEFKNAEVVEEEIEVPAKVEETAKVKKLTPVKEVEVNKEVTPVIENPEVKRPVITPLPKEEEVEVNKEAEEVAREAVAETEEKAVETVEPVEAVEEEKATEVRPGINLDPDDRDLAHYYYLDQLRNDRPLTDDEIADLVEIVERNERARNLENLYTDAIELDTDKAKALHKDLWEKYRAQLSDAFKKAAPVVEVARRVEEPVETAEEEKENTETTVIPVEGSVEDADESAEAEETEEKEEPEVRVVPVTDGLSDEPVEEDKEAEEGKDKPVIPGMTIVRTEKPVEARDVHPVEDDDPEIVDVDGEEIKVNKGSWWKRLTAALLAIAAGVGGFFLGKSLTKTPEAPKGPAVSTDEEVPMDEDTLQANLEELRRLQAEEEARKKAEEEAAKKAEEEKAEEEAKAPVVEEEEEEEQLPPPLTDEEREQAEAEAAEKRYAMVERVKSEQAERQQTETTEAIEAYCEKYDVPAETRAFLYRPEVLTFLNQFKNEAQRNEVLSALCYGYEANILTTEEGNFRLNEDGENYLTSFTSDFLCAKVVVGRYSPKQMLAVFGNSDVSYEQIMNGFKNYCYTVTTYGMNAKKPLPFKYLTNNDKNLTPVLDGLFDKLIVVNKNREAGTLNSTHTDDFISAVFDTFVLNDESLGISEGGKTVAAALVESFVCIQAQISNGEPLYLHEDRGYARAGINLQEVDGHFVIGMPDKTTYEFTSLYDVMSHGYGDQSETASRCLSEQEVLLSNISAMHLLDSSSTSLDAQRLKLANTLQECGLYTEARQIRIGNDSQALLAQIKTMYPMLVEDVEAYEAYKYGTKEQNNDYQNFETITEGVDKLLGINNRKANNYADLINNRRSAYSLYDKYTVVTGKTYTKKRGGSGTPTQGTPEKKVVKVEVTETTEQVTWEQMTPEEQQQAQEKQEELQQQEEQEHQQQEQEIEETKEELREGVQEGKTQEELEEIAEEHGITLDPDYQTEMAAALEEQRQGEEKKEQIEQDVETHNREEEEAAAERRRQEEAAQEEERRRQEELIRQSQEADEAEAHPEDNPDPQPEPDPQPDPQPEDQGPEEVDQTDEGRVDEEAGEEDYIPTAKTQLEQMKRAALALGEIEAEDLGLEGPKGPRGPVLG